MLKKGDKSLLFVLKFVGAIKRIFKFSVKFDNLLSTLNGDGMFLDPRMNGKKVLFHFCWHLLRLAVKSHSCFADSSASWAVEASGWRGWGCFFLSFLLLLLPSVTSLLFCSKSLTPSFIAALQLSLSCAWVSQSASLMSAARSCLLSRSLYCFRGTPRINFPLDQLSIDTAFGILSSSVRDTLSDHRNCLV